MSFLTDPRPCVDQRQAPPAAERKMTHCPLCERVRQGLRESLRQGRQHGIADSKAEHAKPATAPTGTHLGHPACPGWVGERLKR